MDILRYTKKVAAVLMVLVLLPVALSLDALKYGCDRLRLHPVATRLLQCIWIILLWYMLAKPGPRPATGFTLWWGGGNQVDGSSSHSVQVTLYVSDDVFSCLIILFKASAAQIVSITFLLSKLGYVLMNYPLNYSLTKSLDL